MRQDRRPLVIANWKMHKTLAETRAYFVELARHLGPVLATSSAAPEIAVCPGFVALTTAVAARDEAFAGVRRDLRPGVGVQNAHGETTGAYTGEVAAAQAADAGAEYAIIGHSERRREFGEPDALIAARLEGALRAGLVPVLCVGETIEQRRAGEMRAVVDGQTRAAVGGLAAPLVERIAIAYEPVWAIGSGLAASPADAQEVAAHLRAALASAHGERVAAAVRILYGGSVSAGNAGAFMAEPDVDGVLVGGASLDAGAFARIAESARG